MRGVLVPDDTLHDMLIRTEQPRDIAAVHAVNAAAFGREAEADLVDALRQRARPVVSLVAEDDAEIVGHILFSPVSLPSRAALKIMGLAPMAVAPGSQRKGAGSALVRAGIEECRRLDCAAIVVLGHPGYYPRFGFEPAARFGFSSEYGVPEDTFMALELQPGCLGGASGKIRYHSAFSEL